jgi:hypothetical protein
MIQPLTEKDPDVLALQSRIDELWRQVSPLRASRVPTTSPEDGSLHVVVANGRYDLVTKERGLDLERKCNLTIDEAVRWFLFGMASDHASAHELRERQKFGGYSRWNWMAPTISMMQEMAPEYGDWARSYYADALRTAPLSLMEKANTRYPLLQQET